MSRTIVIVLIMAAAMVVSVVFVARSRKAQQQPATFHSVTETNRMPRLDTSPPNFPE